MVGPSVVFGFCPHGGQLLRGELQLTAVQQSDQFRASKSMITTEDDLFLPTFGRALAPTREMWANSRVGH